MYRLHIPMRLKEQLRQKTYEQPSETFCGS